MVAAEKGSGRSGWPRTIVSTLGIIVTTAAAILSVYYAVLQQDRTVVTLEIAQPQSIFDNSNGQSSEVEVRIAGNVVKSAYVSRLTFINSASFPITSAMVEVPLQITFDRSPVFVRPAGSNPEQVAFSAIATDNSVLVTNELINPGDRIYIDVFFEEYPIIDDAACNIRASNVSRCNISRLSEQDRTFYAIPFGGTSVEYIVVWTSIILSVVYLMFFLVLVVFIYISLSFRINMARSISFAQFALRAGLGKRVDPLANTKLRDFATAANFFTESELEQYGDLTISSVSHDAFECEDGGLRSKLYDFTFDQINAALAGISGFSVPRRDTMVRYTSAAQLMTDYYQKLRSANRDVGAILSALILFAVPIVPSISIGLGLVSIFT